MDILRAVIFSIPKSVVGTGVTAAILIMFFGALRQSEVAPITVKQFNPAIHPTRGDVTLTDTSLSMKIKWAKNMQKNGQFRKINLAACKDPRLCPVKTLQAHYDHTPTASSTDPLIMHPGSHHPIPVSVIKSVWDAALTVAKADKTAFSLHSLRKAAATEVYMGGCGGMWQDTNTETRRMEIHGI